MKTKTDVGIPELHFTKKDFRIDWFNCAGAGGQHKNKHANACRITHIETGLTAVGQDHKERHRNQADAFRRLAKKIIAHYTIEEDRSQYTSDERIRSYHEPRNQVLDHASGHRETYKKVVIDGELDNMIDARRKAKLSDEIS